MFSIHVLVENKNYLDLDWRKNIISNTQGKHT